MWVVAVLGAIVAVASGLVPPAVAVDVTQRAAPVLIFLVAVALLAELSDRAGVFDRASQMLARAARGRTLVLFLLVAGLATATTALLSLDTTAVLLTPVVLSLCLSLGLDPLPFAMATVWLANTASLLLPVSNLTNLLAVRRLDLDTLAFAARMWGPALAAVAVTVLVMLAIDGRRLRGRYVPPVPTAPADRVLFAVAAGCCLAFTVMVLAEVDVTVAAVCAAVPCVVVFAVRRPRDLTAALVPWRLVVLVVGLFVVVEAAQRHGLPALLGAVAGQGESTLDLMRLAAGSAVGANLVNNLPAYLALEPVAGASTPRLLAVLIGVGTGPVVLLWGSLATLLWRERCLARGVTISAGTFARRGLVLAPLVVGVAVLALRPPVG